jgi:hypothetical protein
MGKPVTVPIPLIQDQLFIRDLLLNFPNNLAGGTHAKGLKPKAQSLTPKTLPILHWFFSNSPQSPILLSESSFFCVLVLDFRLWALGLFLHKQDQCIFHST